ncbi:CBS domain-containing protein, partial [Vibrio sp. 10N.222.55.C6]
MSYSWEKTIVKPEATIVDALRVIDSEALRIALVVDDEQHLLGVVTDGDIRRGILNSLPLDTPIVEIM